jgi:uncharacterized protein (UPF0305 family)
MTKSEIYVAYLCDGKKKEISLSKVDRKYFPPQEEGTQVAMDSAYMTFLINYVQNRLTEEFNAEYEKKKREEELKEMEERENKYRELEKQQRQTAANYGIAKLYTSRGYVCPFCFISISLSPKYPFTASTYK